MAKKAAASSTPANPLEQAKGLLQKVFASKKMSDPFVKINENDFTQSLPHIPTGSVMIDYLIGGRLNRYGIPPCPGLPRGRISNLYGQESSGKTTLALTAAANVCRLGGTVCYIDWENAIVVAYAKALGVPIDSNVFDLAQPETMEQGLSVLWTMAKAGVDLIVLDSVGAGVPKAVMEQSLDEKGKAARVGLVAQMWSGFLPGLRNIIAKSGSSILGISQLRKNINTTGYGGDGTTTQGGEAWKFYSDVRFGLRRIKTEKSKEYDIMLHSSKEELSTGAIIRARADKCKVSAAQGREVQMYIRFGEGIDDLRSIIDFAAKHGIVKKDGSWYRWERGNGETIRHQGMDEFKAAVRDTAGAADELYKTVIAKMYDTDILVPEDDAAEEEATLDIETILEGQEEKQEADEQPE